MTQNEQLHLVLSAGPQKVRVSSYPAVSATEPGAQARQVVARADGWYVPAGHRAHSVWLLYMSYVLHTTTSQTQGHRSCCLLVFPFLWPPRAPVCKFTPNVTRTAPKRFYELVAGRGGGGGGECEVCVWLPVCSLCTEQCRW